MVRTINGSSSINSLHMMHGAIKYAAVGLLRSCLSAATFPPLFFFSFKLSDCILQCLNDGTPDVRDSAFSVLAAVAKVVFPFKKKYCKFLASLFATVIVTLKLLLSRLA